MGAPETVPLQDEIGPKPIPRLSENPLQRVINLHWVPFIHLILVIVISAIVIFIIDGIHVVGLHERSGPRTKGTLPLSVADVTTGVSAALTIVRTLVAGFTAMAAWRCAFILMELSKRGLNLNELRTIISWKLPARMGGKFEFMINVVLILMVPASFCAPILSGAIDWNVRIADLGTTVEINQSPIPVYPGGWYWAYYGSWQAIIRAAGLESQIWSTPEDPVNITITSRRIINAFNTTVPIGTKLSNVSLPYFEVEDLTWDNGPPSDMTINVIKNNGEDVAMLNPPPLSLARMTSYNGSGSGVPFDAGNTLTKWSNNLDLFPHNGSGKFPKAIVYEGIKKIAIVLFRAQGYQNSTACDRSILQESIFGDPSYLPNFVSNFSHDGDYWAICVAVGTMKIRAGIIHAQEGIILAGNVLEAKFPKNGSGQNLTLYPNTWVLPAIQALPDVMSFVANANSTSLGTWNDLQGYTVKLLTHSYSAAWHSFYLNWDDTSLSGMFPETLNARTPVPYQVAKVSGIRVFVWLTLNMLLSFSDFLLWYLEEKYCRRAPVSDGTRAAILLNPTQILDDKQVKKLRLGNLSYVTKEDSKTVGSLKLVKVGSSGDAEFELERGDA